MTVKEIKEELSKYPDNMEVFMAERKTEFAYGLVNNVCSKTISFKESPEDNKVLAKDKVVVFDEE